jgi:alpha-ribazole phosphatase
MKLYHEKVIRTSVSGIHHGEGVSAICYNTIMELLLVRHVETQGNLEHRFNGVTESEYSPFGIYMKSELHKELLTQLKNVDSLRIYCSPISRAAKIAEELGADLNCKPIYSDELREFNFGIFDGLTPEEAEKRDHDAYFKWMNNHLYEQIPEGDSYEQKYNEACGWIEKLVYDTQQQEQQSGKEQTVVLVGHGAVLRCMLTALMDLPLDAGWHIDIPLGGIALVNYTGDYGILKRLYTPDYHGGSTAGYSKKFIH